MNDFDATTYNWSAMAPELLVSDIDKSLVFWRDIIGFRVMYDRVTFYYLDYQGIQFMLQERDGTWETGKMQKPFGRGINFEIRVDAIAPILESLKKHKWPLYEEPKVKQRRFGTNMGEAHEFLVQDPDGYLLRFAENLGRWRTSD